MVAIADSVDRELRKRNGSEDPRVVDEDAAGIARVLIRHYGDDAPRILGLSADVATLMLEAPEGPEASSLKKTSKPARVSIDLDSLDSV